MSESAPVITEQFIRDEFNRLTALCQDAASAWKVKVKCLVIEPLRHTGRSTIYGTASSSGQITINSVLIGTENIESLRATIVHELAHLCVGLEYGHKPKFKSKLAIFRHVCGINTAQVHQQRALLQESISQKKPAPLELFAHTMCGKKVSLGKCFRKSRKYSDYHPSFGVYKINGLPINRFEYAAL